MLFAMSLEELAVSTLVFVILAGACIGLFLRWADPRGEVKQAAKDKATPSLLKWLK